jgi:CheY-like chemotaxis protein
LPYIAYILIVDTQAELRQHLVRMLEQAGHRATTVATVWEAPEACAAAATARERKPAPAHVAHRGNGLEASV